MTTLATKPRIIFAGTPTFAAEQLSALIQQQANVVAVYTQPDRPAKRGKKMTASAVKQVAVEHDITVYQPITLRDEASVNELQSL